MRLIRCLTSSTSHVWVNMPEVPGLVNMSISIYIFKKKMFWPRWRNFWCGQSKKILSSLLLIVISRALVFHTTHQLPRCQPLFVAYTLMVLNGPNFHQEFPWILQEFFLVCVGLHTCAGIACSWTSPPCNTTRKDNFICVLVCEMFCRWFPSFE